MLLRVLSAGLLAATLVLPTGRAAFGSMDVTEALQRMRQASFAGKDMHAQIAFDIVNAKGESVRWVGRYFRRNAPETRIRLSFDAPADLHGTEVSVVGGAKDESRVSVYLPSLRRVREISGDMRGESFFGTDFNYEDLGLQPLAFQQHALTEAKDPAGRDCYRIESTPQHGWWYGRIVRFVDRTSFLPLRTEYYDRAGVLWKVRTLGKIQTIASHPTATEITMETVPTKTSTRITLSEIAYDTELDDSAFPDL
ncbi:MAG: outer membrane lipoprotein-sorting protein [Deltaproteobacteria bacterium]|nr:outer membrane lipoprotein-sorting protein [Deltaproteobacteria bacterium]